MLLLLALTIGSLIRTAWRSPRALDRSRALGLLFFLGASGTVAFGLGWGRPGFRFNYPTLTILTPCCLYFAWMLEEPRGIGRFFEGLLFACMGLAALMNIAWDVPRARGDDAQKTAFERDLRQGTSPYTLLARHRETLNSGVSSRYLHMLHEAGVEPFRSLQEDPAFGAVPIPLEPSETHRVKWENNTIEGADRTAYITINLKKSISVAYIRIIPDETERQRNHRLFSMAWKSANDSTFPPPQYQEGLVPTTIPVGATIDQIRIYPDRAPVSDRSDFPMLKLEVLVPEDRFRSIETRASANRGARGRSLEVNEDVGH
jgi:hypothetical protein